MDKVWAIRPEKNARVLRICMSETVISFFIGPLYFPVEVHENSFDLSLAKVAKMSEKERKLSRLFNLQKNRFMFSEFFI